MISEKAPSLVDTPARKERMPAVKAASFSVENNYGEVNGDRYVCEKAVINGIEIGIFGVFDGIGSGGAEAAHIAEMTRNTILGITKSNPENPPTIEWLKDRLCRAIYSASQVRKEYLQTLKTDILPKNISCTVCVGLTALIDGKHVLISANLGDSRLYKVNADATEMTQLTTDDVGMEDGRSKLAKSLTEGDALNELKYTDAQADKEKVWNHMQVRDFELQPGETIAVVTDGMYNMLATDIVRGKLIQSEGQVQIVVQEIETMIKVRGTKTPHDDATMVLAQV